MFVENCIQKVFNHHISEEADGQHYVYFFLLGLTMFGLKLGTTNWKNGGKVSKTFEHCLL